MKMYGKTKLREFPVETNKVEIRAVGIHIWDGFYAKALCYVTNKGKPYLTFRYGWNVFHPQLDVT